jgi:hypothetical protein
VLLPTSASGPQRYAEGLHAAVAEIAGPPGLPVFVLPVSGNHLVLLRTLLPANEMNDTCSLNIATSAFARSMLRKLRSANAFFGMHYGKHAKSVDYVCALWTLQKGKAHI